MLLDYLETRYPTASMEEKARFVELLKLDDAELMTQGFDMRGDIRQ